MEGEFETLLKTLQPSKRLGVLIKAMFRDAWDQLGAQAASTRKSLEHKIRDSDKQVEAA